MSSLFTCKLCPAVVFDTRKEVQDHFFLTHVDELSPVRTVEERVRDEVVQACLDISVDVGFAHANSAVDLVRAMTEEIRSLRDAASEKQKQRAEAEQKQMQVIRKEPRPSAQLRLPSRGLKVGFFRCPKCNRPYRYKSWLARHKCDNEDDDEQSSSQSYDDADAANVLAEMSS